MVQPSDDNEPVVLLVGNPTLGFKGFQVALTALLLAWTAGQRFKVRWISQVAIDIGGPPFPIEFVVDPPQDQLPRLYASARLLLFTSWYEAFGLPPLEAMACGIPVVSTTCGGVSTFAKDGINALLCVPGDVRAIGHAVSTILEDPKLCERLGRNGRETALAFNADTKGPVLEEALLRVSNMGDSRAAWMADTRSVKDSPLLPRVFSHPRSGTHFLMAMLKKNFYPDVDLFDRGDVGGHWADLFPTEPREYAALFGGHHFFVPELLGQPILYIYRDGRDVAVSLWKAKAMQHPSWRDLSFSEFLRKPLDWEATTGNRVQPRFTIAEHWYLHVQTWLAAENENTDEIHGLRYEDLLLHPEKSLGEMASFLKSSSCDWHSVSEKVGISPAEAEAGTWRRHFSEEDIDFFFSLVPKDFDGLVH